MKRKSTKSPLIGKKKGFKSEGRQIVCSICEEAGGTLTKIADGEYVHPFCFQEKLEKRGEKKNEKIKNES